MNKLLYWRMKQGLTLEDLAQKSGVNRDTISRIENGRNARPAVLGKLAMALQIEPTEFEVLLAAKPVGRGGKKAKLSTPDEILEEIATGDSSAWETETSTDHIHELGIKFGIETNTSSRTLETGMLVELAEGLARTAPESVIAAKIPKFTNVSPPQGEIKPVQVQPETITPVQVQPETIEPIEVAPETVEPVQVKAVYVPPLPAPRRGKKTFEAVLEEAPVNSVEYRIHEWHGAEVLTSEIEVRIDYLQNRAKRTFSAEYKKLAIAYLQAVLVERRRIT